jgi:hypothetical protein
VRAHDRNGTSIPSGSVQFANVAEEPSASTAAESITPTKPASGQKIETAGAESVFELPTMPNTPIDKL